MTTDMVSLDAHPRAILGKKVKQLRRGGLTPIHLYGRGLASLSLQAETANLRRVLVRVGKNRPVSVLVDGEKDPYLAFVREIQFHPLTEEVLHVDFYRVEMGHRLQVEVPVTLTGDAPAVRVHGGSLIQALRLVLVECLPLEVPNVFSVDVSHLESFDQVIRVNELQIPANVTVLTDLEQLVVQVAPPGREAREEAGVEEASAPALAKADQGTEEPTAE